MTAPTPLPPEGGAPGSQLLRGLQGMLLALGLDPAAGVSHPANFLGLIVHRTLVEATLGSALDVVIRLLGCRRAAPMARYDFAAGLLLGACRWITGRGVPLIAVEYPFPAPPPALREGYERVYGVPVRFDRPDLVLVLAPDALDSPIPTANAAMAGMFDSMLSVIEERTGASLSIKVKHLLAKRLQKGEPCRQEVARSLAMSERMLQRRLAAEGTSYADLLDAVRRELAQRFLSNGQLSPTEMSYRLGFADPSNFYRACRRWFGQPPSQLLPPQPAPARIASGAE